MKKINAKILAIKALTWLVGREEMLEQFLTTSGHRAQDLAQRVDDDEMHLAILEFLLLNDSWIISFCDSEGEPYSSILEARMGLLGGAEMVWE